MIGYMLNSYEESGPEDIMVFPTEKELRDYISAHPEIVTDNVELAMEQVAEFPNSARDIAKWWGGHQVTRLVYGGY